jgi:hypothetical protein
VLSGISVRIPFVSAVLKSRRYSAREVEEALLEIVVNGGNSVTASQRLAERGIEVSDRLLRYWRTNTHRDRYAELAEEHSQHIEKIILQGARENAILAAEVERKALAATLTQIEAGELKDASTAARNAATVKGINVDKALQLTGRPTQITEKRNLQEITRSLIAAGVLKQTAVDGTAEEVT